MSKQIRQEMDLLGEREIPSNVLWGIHALRASENFPVTGRSVHPNLIHAYGEVKLACAKTNYLTGFLEETRFSFIKAACYEMSEGRLDDWIIVDPYQGGAGTSTNLNVCEVIANRALQLAGKNPGDYHYIDPIEHVNLHQSTNDTFPSALRIAVFKELKKLESLITDLQVECEAKEKEFATIMKIGRTEMMDAIPITLGREFGAWAEAFARDRWRVYKCTERIRVINLGGTAVGTGLDAPRDYIFKVTDVLREITGIPLARAENLFEATQNQDVFVEVSGILKAHAMNLLKISGDLRLMASGPDTGFGEIQLPEMQAGSSIMPGKINPVIPEMMAQAAIQASSCDHAITWSAGMGQLELNAFMPLIAENILNMIDLLAAASKQACEKCIRGIIPDTDRLENMTWKSIAIAAVLVPYTGYNKAGDIAKAMRYEGLTIFEAALREAGLTRETVESLITPDALNALGFTPESVKKLSSSDSD